MHGIHGKKAKGENMEMRGVVFSFDAMLAITIIITLIATGGILAIDQKSDGANQQIVHQKASDNAVKNFYTGQNSIEDPADYSALDNVNCTNILEFDTSQPTIPEAISSKEAECEPEP